MRRARIPLNERLAQLRFIKQRERENDERQRILDKEFRKGAFFIIVTLVRAIYIICFVAVLFLHYKSGGFTKERLLDKQATTYTSYSKRGSSVKTDLYFETDKGSYSATLGGRLSDLAQEGDDLLIERNIFGRAIYFTEAGWDLKYPTDNPFFFYYAIAFLTFISAFFHGAEQFTVRLLWIIGIVNVIGLLGYFLDLY